MRTPITTDEVHTQEPCLCLGIRAVLGCNAGVLTHCSASLSLSAEASGLLWVRAALASLPSARKRCGVLSSGTVARRAGGAARLHCRWPATCAPRSAFLQGCTTIIMFHGLLKVSKVHCMCVSKHQNLERALRWCRQGLAWLDINRVPCCPRWLAQEAANLHPPQRTA